ncbi:MAG: hypothetical protein ACRDCE_18045 [Cetobacterium sp.]|uniref:hypothetical protein n=1 Tax=Cetobacterium sp. TaxID=2071632 RepID=UPI003EE68283
MNLEEQLAQYRQRFSFQAAQADAKEVSPWEGEIESLKETEEEDIRDVWASEVESDMNTAYSPTRREYDEFVQGMMSNEKVMKHQPAIEEALNELLSLINDPSSPMDVQTAQGIMTEMMEKHVRPDFVDEPQTTNTKKGGK